MPESEVASASGADERRDSISDVRGRRTSHPLAGPLRAKAWASRGETQPSSSTLDLISDKPNRWNVRGEPTIYLSGDPALALIESGRHPDDLEDRAQLIEVDIAIPLAIDIRDPEVRSELGLPDDLLWVLDRRRAREVAGSLRHSGICDAIQVPSAGALDQVDRWNVVVFADDRRAIQAMVQGLRSAGELVLSADT